MSGSLAALADKWDAQAHEYRYSPGAMPFTAEQIERCAKELRELAARLPGDVEQDAARYRLLRSKAHQKTAYDVYGDGGLWTIGIHSNDNRLSLDDVIDAQLPATPTASPAAGIGEKL